MRRRNQRAKPQDEDVWGWCSALQCVAVWCSLLQCNAVCCRMNQRAEPRDEDVWVVRFFAVCCSVLQWFAGVIKGSSLRLRKEEESKDSCVYRHLQSFEQEWWGILVLRTRIRKNQRDKPQDEDVFKILHVAPYVLVGKCRKRITQASNYHLFWTVPFLFYSGLCYFSSILSFGSIKPKLPGGLD